MRGVGSLCPSSRLSVSRPADIAYHDGPCCSSNYQVSFPLPSEIFFLHICVRWSRAMHALWKAQRSYSPSQTTASYFFDCRLQDIYYHNFGDISVRDGPLSGSGSETQESGETMGNHSRNATSAVGTSARRDLVETADNHSYRPGTAPAQSLTRRVRLAKSSHPPLQESAGRGRRAGRYNARDGTNAVRGLVSGEAGGQHRRKGAGKGRPTSTSSAARSQQSQASGQVARSFLWISRCCVVFTSNCAVTVLKQAVTIVPRLPNSGTNFPDMTFVRF